MPQQRLDIGCGQHKLEGWVGMDKRPLPGVDVVHDVEIFPWPFEDSTFSEVRAWHVMEHLKPWLTVDVMNEIWRVMAPGGQLVIAVPSQDSIGFLQDPTHVRTWNEVTPLYFDPGYPCYSYYRPQPWRILSRQIYHKPVPEGTIFPGPNWAWKFTMEKA